jgi:hypothetical protein
LLERLNIARSQPQQLRVADHEPLHVDLGGKNALTLNHADSLLGAMQKLFKRLHPTGIGQQDKVGQFRSANVGICIRLSQVSKLFTPLASELD